MTGCQAVVDHRKKNSRCHLLPGNVKNECCWPSVATVERVYRLPRKAHLPWVDRSSCESLILLFDGYDKYKGVAP